MKSRISVTAGQELKTNNRGIVAQTKCIKTSTIGDRLLEKIVGGTRNRIVGFVCT